ncbi:hypothetical protein [Paraburkholderia panacisoli]|uniref:hypothetical protein n=1 Tax=Paraburkholderia panacisoli TaxID=2603818 RepID=UPI003CCC6361
MHGTGAFLSRMRKQEGEKLIVNTSSIAGVPQLAGHLLCNTSRVAVAFISEATAQELVPEVFSAAIRCSSFADTDVSEEEIHSIPRRGVL